MRGYHSLRTILTINQPTSINIRKLPPRLISSSPSFRTMSSTPNSNSTNPPPPPPSSPPSSANMQPAEEQPPQKQSTPLPLPAPSSQKATQLSVDGEGVKLDHLGPLVVNENGTLSRIANWGEMAEIERENTLRILGRRNRMRQEALKKKADEEAGAQGKANESG